jgi:recombination protein RecT
VKDEILRRINMGNIVKRDEILKQSHAALQKLLKSKADALPKDFNETRFLQNCMTVLQDTKDIEKCQPISIARTMLKGAFLGLDFFNKECYAIPYGNQLNFQTDYKGEIKLAKKYSINPIKDIYAKLVREGDEFQEEIIDGKQTINFKPKSFNNGEILGAFAVVLFKDGSMMYETMSKEEIESIRENFSKAKNSAAWTKTPGEMYKKTVLRRLCKLIELDFDTIEQQKAFEEASDFEFKNEPTTKEESPFNEAVEVEYEEVSEELEQEQLDLTGTPFEEGEK